MHAFPAHAEVIQVTIKDLVFSPAEVAAKAGDTIRWINRDIIAHTATVRGGFDVMIPATESASVVLKKVGAVNCYCRFHPNMTGRISIAPE